MRHLILSDIHANLEAFEKCLEAAAEKYDRAVCLGDVVGYGPDPNAVIDRVRETVEVTIRGNHDKACAGITDASDFNPIAREATFWTRDELTPEHLAYLRQLPQGPVTRDGFQMVHGSASDEDEYILHALQAVPALEQQTISLVFFGHTHHQGGFLLADGAVRPIHSSVAEEAGALTLPIEEGVRYLINPGSVGQPRDGDWRAAFAILDQEKRQVEYYRVRYDVRKTQDKMQKADLPELLIARLEFGR